MRGRERAGGTERERERDTERERESAREREREIVREKERGGDGERETERERRRETDVTATFPREETCFPQPRTHPASTLLNRATITSLKSEPARTIWLKHSPANSASSLRTPNLSKSVTGGHIAVWLFSHTAPQQLP